MPRTTCLTNDELRAFHLGDLPETELEDLAEHLESCPGCEEAARALDGVSDPEVAAYRRSGRSGPLAGAWTAPARVGEYEILGEIGRGGMGVVYRARHLALRRIVALKMLLAGSFARSDERARFAAEAGAVARLHHPNIVGIYEFGECRSNGELDPRPYFTLEYVDGGNLAGRFAGTPSPPRQAAVWVEALARATHYAHQQGVVHRDLKPSNVLLTADGTPKICDFGVAKLLTGADLKTRSGALIGTPEYMAPEQALGNSPVGPPADVYALGALLYTALTGGPPFQGASVLDTLQQVRGRQPAPPSRYRPDVPRDLETICLKCLEKEPGKRYLSALDLADDLRRFLGDQPIQARRASPWERLARWMRQNRAAAASLAVVLGTLAIAVFVSTWAAIQKEHERVKALAAEASARVAQERAETAQKRAEEQHELAVRNLYLAKTNITGMTLDAPGGISQAAGFLAEWRGLEARDDPRGWEWFYCQTLLDHDQRTLHGHTVDAASLTWSPDGRRLASGGFDKTIRIWDADTGRQLLSFAAPWGILSVSWRPDGRQLASADWWDRTVTIWNPDTGKKVRTLTGHKDQLRWVAFHPDSRRLASADQGGQVIVWDAVAGKPLFRLANTGKGTNAVCWSPDGRRLASSSADHTVKVFDSDTGKETAVLRGHAGAVWAVCWSRDGGQLASSSHDGTIRIWGGTPLSLVRSIPAPLIDDFEGQLCWSPDGRQLAGACRDLAIRVWDAESGEVVRTLRGHGGSKIAAVCWRPDGGALASAERGWNGEIKVWKLDAPPLLRTLEVGRAGDHRLEVCWSPDGRRLASGATDGMVRIWDSATGRLHAALRGHTGEVRKVSWRPDGGALASAGSDGTVKVWNPATRRLEATFPGQGQPISWVAWSPDGKRLAANATDGAITIRDVRAGSSRRAAVKGWAAAWCPVDDRLALGEHYKIIIYSSRTDAAVLDWTTPCDFDNRPIWSPDGQRIALIVNQTVHVWAAATGRGVFAPLQHNQPVNVVAWSPDSKQLAVATADDLIHLWDAVTGNLILSLRGSGRVQSVAWSPDGMQLAFAGGDGAIRIWDATRGYERERAAALLPKLDALLARQPENRDARALRAGVIARLGRWDRAALDAQCWLDSGSKGAPGLFQAGWWVVDASQPDPASGQGRPRWYLSADDPNGYVPLARDSLFYLTWVYASKDQEAGVQLECPGQVKLHLQVNGAEIDPRGPTRATLKQGWNILSVRLDDSARFADALMRPRTGFYLHLSAPRIGEKLHQP